MWDQAVIAAVCTGAALLIREAVGQYVTARKAGREGGTKERTADQRRRQQDQEFQSDQFRQLIALLQADLDRAYARIALLERGAAPSIRSEDAELVRRKVSALADLREGNANAQPAPERPGGG